MTRVGGSGRPSELGFHKQVFLYVEGFDFISEFGVTRMQRRVFHLQGFKSVGELVLLLAGLVGFNLRGLQLVLEGLD